MTAAHKLEPALPAGNTSYNPATAVYHTCFDNTKSLRVLGIEYRGIEETTKDCIALFKALGWL